MNNEILVVMIVGADESKSGLSLEMAAFIV